MVLRNCDNASCQCGKNLILASLMRQLSNGVRISVPVLPQMAESLNISFEWNIIRPYLRYTYYNFDELTFRRVIGNLIGGPDFREQGV